MKLAILGLLTAVSIFTSQNANACTITPKGDSERRVHALHETIGHMEVLTGFKTTVDGMYQLTVQDFSRAQDSDREITRIYKLEDTGPMCPEYQAIRIY